MSLIPCPECSTEISEKANSCPRCGHPIKKKVIGNDGITLSKSVLLPIVLVVVVLGGLCLWIGSHANHNKGEMEVVKPAMPVVISYRKALLGDGLVADFRNLSNRQLSVIATFTNPTFKLTRSFRLDLSPNTLKEVGHLEGWNFASGDHITLLHNDYTALNVVLP